MGELQKRIKDRIEGIIEYLKENHPSMDLEQYHLDEGTMERYYWHYGYVVALKDIMRKFEEAKKEFLLNNFGCADEDVLKAVDMQYKVYKEMIEEHKNLPLRDLFNSNALNIIWFKEWFL